MGRRRRCGIRAAPGKPPSLRCGYAPAESLVDRGEPVELHLEAMGRKAATLWFRAPGEAWKARGVRLDSLGRATVSTAPLQSDLFARLTSGSRSSDTVVVRVRLPVFLGALNVIARYPAYLGLETEPVPTGGDTLILPAGTRLETRGEATAPPRQRRLEIRREDRIARGDRKPVRRDLRPPAFGRVPPGARNGERRAARRRLGAAADPAGAGQRARGRDPGARRRHPGSAQPSGAADHRRAGRPQRHRRDPGEPADQPPGHRSTPRGGKAYRCRPNDPTAPFSPSRSISIGAACFRATPCATSPPPGTTRRGDRPGARASSCFACRR